MAENPLRGKSIWRKIHLAENPFGGTKFPPNGLSAKWIFRDKNRCPFFTIIVTHNNLLQDVSYNFQD